MATDRVAKILKSSGVFSDDQIAGMTEDEAWQWIHDNTPAPRPTDIESCETENNILR